MSDAARMELLAPAQGPEQLEMAIHFGADAVYLAAPRWGMRAGARNFAPDELARAVERAHEQGVSMHLTLNTVMRDEDADELPVFLQGIDELGVDAAIVADLGAMALVRQHAPHVEIHVSTQASVMSAAAAEQYARLGARRIVLAREMTLAQIAELRRRLTREVELEAFAHGSMCMAYSGRCLLSAELMGSERSAARGACAQPCRWAWELVEERSGARLGLEAGEGASYLLSSNDLCLIGHLGELAEAGVDAIKIEGRSKGSYYTACVTNAYRHVLDGEPAEAWAGELDAVSHRPYSTGFLLGEPTQNPGRVDYARERTMVGVVRGCQRAGERWLARVECRNRADAGDELVALSPGHAVRGLGALERPLVRNGETYELFVPFELGKWDLLCR
jgi:putative protease